MNRLVLVPLFVAGCIFAPPTAANQATPSNLCDGVSIVHQYYLDSSVKDYDNVIVQAMTAWATGTGGRVKWERVYNPTNLAILTFEAFGDDDLESVDAKNDALTLGLFNPGTNEIRIATRRIKSGRMFRAVLVHELGHALGLIHNNHSVLTWMRPSVEQIPEELVNTPFIPAPDIQAYWRLDNCNRGANR